MANQNGEIRALTGIRGVACIYVMLYHFGFAGILPDLFAAFAHHGYLAVDLFFILSGFVMAMVYGGYFIDGFDSGNYKKFIAKRIARIYPVYIFMTLVFIFFFSVILDEVPKNVSSTPFDLTANVLSIQAWGLSDSYIGPAWSISTEWAAYFLLPLLLPVTLFGSRSSALLTLLLCALILISICILPHEITGIVTSRGMLDMSDGKNYAPLIRCITEFTIGLITYRFYKRNIFLAIRNGRYFSLIIATLMVAFLFIDDGDIFFVALVPFLLLSLADDVSPVAKMLSWRPVYLTGELSYSLYLVHGLISWLHYLIKQSIFALGLPYPNLFILLSQVSLSLALATLVHLYIERPGKKHLLRIFESRKMAVPVYK